MSYKPTYSVYRYNYNGSFILYNKCIHGSNKRFPTVWEALEGVRKLAREKVGGIAGGKTELELLPDLQYIIVEFFKPGISRIACVVTQKEIMQEKFSYKIGE